MSQEVLERVTKCIAEVLALEPAEIQPSSRLMEDLGAESLDLVELMFLLEQEFDTELRKEDMSLSAQLGLPEEEIHQDQVLTEKALQLLRQKYPDSDSILVAGVTVKHLAALLTVTEVARAVERKIK